MNTSTVSPSAQEIAIAALERQGFRFSNWIPSTPDADGNPSESDASETAVMVKRGATRFGREYREVSPDGSVN